MVSPLLKQTWVASGVLLSMFAQGIILGFTSVLLHALQAPGSDIKIDVNAASTIASVSGMGAATAFLVSSIFMEIFGRRLAYRLAILPGIIGWIFIYNANSISLLIAGRVFGGFTGGSSVALGAVVIAEYTSPKNRGMFLNLKTAAVCLGNLVVHMLGHFYHWRTVALIALVPCVVSLLIVLTWPESPSWLATKHKYEESEKSFYWLRGRNAKSASEIRDLLSAQKDRIDNSINLSYSTKLKEFLKKFTRKDFVKPFIIIVSGSLLLESCGRHVFPAFALQIAEEVTGSKGQSFYYILGIDIIITISATFSSYLVKIFKRRTLLFSTGFAALLVLYIVCGYLYLASINVISSTSTLVPILLFVLYFILSNLGCTPIPLALLGEIFPLAHRGAGSCIAGLLLALCLTISMKVTPYLLVNIKVYGTFALLGSVMGLSLFVLWLILPETKDKTLQEIEYYMNHGEYKQKIDDDSKTKMIPA
ncbi:facilitated trehalose transporter Tret1-like [Aricia agestis]|uniref:facilitated trehalose transporter Tret1-like n=1 Tax=Aricia agestis TaxID=91739 RepID=UPI001C204B1D|nr:facilitated trehalose transporter Tret1-like [Aricia agestis]